MAFLDGSPVAPAALQALGLVNYGHFTSLRVEPGGVRGLSHHLDRLTRDCREVLDADLDHDQVRANLKQALAGVPRPIVARVTIFDPGTDLAAVGISARPHVLVTVRPAPPARQPPLRVRPLSYQRDVATVKHTGLFGALHARGRAQRDGFDDALFVDAEGCVTEGPTWNLGLFDGEHVLWPAGDLLQGVTMRLLQQVHDQTITERVGVTDLGLARAVFATNTAIGIRPITTIGQTSYPGEHPILDLLRKEYEDIPPERL